MFSLAQVIAVAFVNTARLLNFHRVVQNWVTSVIILFFYCLMVALKGSRENSSAMWITHKWSKILADLRAASADKWSCIGRIVQINVALLRSCN